MSLNLDEQMIADLTGSGLFNSLEEKRDSICLDKNLWTFQQQRFVLNDLLIEKKMFLIVCGFNKKFCSMIKNGLQKNQVHKDLLVCVEERYNGFEIVRKLF